MYFPLIIYVSFVSAQSISNPFKSIIKDLNLQKDGELTNHIIENVYSSTEIPQVYISTRNCTTITSQTGATVFLPCVVNNIGDGMVSWVRKRDYHLLTVGLATYSSDERFQVIHLHQSNDWTLQIKYAHKRDVGQYECQVSSHPPVSILVFLHVIDAKAQIYGPSDRYLRPSSKLLLQCTILHSTEFPAFIFWYHNGRMINYDSDRGFNVTNIFDEKKSILVVKKTFAYHSGNYTCFPSNTQSASVYVHILNGENPAAMQQGAKGLSLLHCHPPIWLIFISLIYIFY